MSALVTPATVEQVGPFERHTLPSGIQVCYHDDRHAYFRDCRENPKRPDGWSGVGQLTGISTVVGPLDWESDNLMRWAANLNCEGIAALYAEAVAAESLDELRSSLAWLTSGESIVAALESASLTWQDLRDDRGRQGTSVHRHALHALAAGAAVPDRASLTDEEWGYARGVMAFWHECEPEPEQAEFVVADLDLGVAGRADLLATVTYNGMRHRAIVDAKTGGFIPTKAHAQIAGYQSCAETSGYGPTEIGLILQVDAQGGYRLLPVCATPDDFRAAVDTYRRAARIKRDLTAALRAAA